MKETKPMAEYTSILQIASVILPAVYVTLGSIFLFFQETLRKSQIGLAEGHLIYAAIALALFGGLASYTLQLQQKRQKFDWKDLQNNIILSGFVALVVALVSSGHLENEKWLGLVLVSAFFKNIFLAIIPEAIKQKTRSYGIELKDEESDKKK